MRAFAQAIATVVFAPDYGDGPWFVSCCGKRRLCANQSTATAWARYLARRGFSFSRHGLAVGKQIMATSAKAPRARIVDAARGARR